MIKVGNDSKARSYVISDLHTGLECIRSYTRRCMSQQERDHFNKLYYGTNVMIKDLCSEGAYQEGTYVIFNLILIQFAEIVLLSFSLS